MHQRLKLDIKAPFCEQRGFLGTEVSQTARLLSFANQLVGETLFYSIGPI